MWKYNAMPLDASQIWQPTVNLILVTKQTNPTVPPTDDNKDKIAQSGALVPLTKLAASRDLRVQVCMVDRLNCPLVNIANSVTPQEHY
jgi:hypothetical protein